MGTNFQKCELLYISESKFVEKSSVVDIDYKQIYC